jgi:hypothetical protein
MHKLAPVIVTLALGAACLAGCGGSGASGRPATLEDVANWMHDETGGCTAAVVEYHLPLRAAQLKQAGTVAARFDRQASRSAFVECEDWVSGWTAYYEFPSTRALRTALAGQDRLREHTVYCARGRELLVNELFGHDYTADFCKRLGFAIHRPPRHRLSA